MEFVLIMGVLGAVVCSLLTVLFWLDRSNKQALVAFVLAVIFIIGIIVSSIILNNESQAVYDNFQNGSYTIDAEKTFDVYKGTHSEELGNIMTDVVKGSNQADIQKYSIHEFIVTINGKHYILGNSMIKELLEEKAITLN